MIKVSVIVPVYNVEKYIIRCLDSILNQTVVKSIELILVDDCGNDKSMDLAKEFLVNQTLLQYKIVYHNKNKGLSVARNTGLSVASGDYVYFLDSDDEITYDCIELLLNPLKEQDYDVVVGDFVAIGGDTTIKLWIETGALIGNEKILKEFIDNRWYAMPCNKLYRTKFVNDNRLLFKEGIIHEDELWSFDISLCVNSMYIVKTVTYKYYINPGSIMTSMKAKNHFNCWAIILLEMMHNAKLREKYNNYNVFNYIEVLKTNFTCEAFRLLNKKDFWEYYCILSKGNWNPLKTFFEGKLSFKRTLKDLCFYLPTKIGFYYLCTWYKLTLKDL